MSEESKAMVRRMVEDINSGEIEPTVDVLFAPRAARRVKRLFTEFYNAFPDWREEIVELVAEESTVAGRFRCSGTHLGEFLGEAPRVSGWRWKWSSTYEWRATGSWTSGRWRTAWSGCGSSACSRHEAAGGRTSRGGARV